MATRRGLATRADFARAISDTWRKSVECIIKTGRLLIRAKAALNHGEFGAMIRCDLPFSARTCQELMAIARHPILSKAQHAAHLPPQWSTLAELARLPAARVKDMIKRGAVRPDMRRRDLFSGECRWFTPAEIVESSRRVLGGRIDLDPFSEREANLTVRARKFYTARNDGLQQHWRGTVFANPPYGTEIMQATVDKLVEHYDAGDVPAAILLAMSSTSARWFQDLMQVADAVCFARERLNFRAPDDRPGETGAFLFGSTIVYLGPDRTKFATVFSPYGAVMRIADRRSTRATHADHVRAVAA